MESMNSYLEHIDHKASSSELRQKLGVHTHSVYYLYISQSIDLKETHVHLMLKKKKLCSANAGMLNHIVLYCMEFYCMELYCIALNGIVWHCTLLPPSSGILPKLDN